MRLCLGLSLCRGGLWSLGSRYRCLAGVTYPDQDAAILVHRQPSGRNEFFLQILDVVIIQGKLPLQRTIRRPALPLEKRNDQGEYLIEVHQRPSTCASAT